MSRQDRPFRRPRASILHRFRHSGNSGKFATEVSLTIEDKRKNDDSAAAVGFEWQAAIKSLAATNGVYHRQLRVKLRAASQGRSQDNGKYRSINRSAYRRRRRR
jgi:hypothetical protein